MAFIYLVQIYIKFSLINQYSKTISIQIENEAELLLGWVAVCIISKKNCQLEKTKMVEKLITKERTINFSIKKIVGLKFGVSSLALNSSNFGHRPSPTFSVLRCSLIVQLPFFSGRRPPYLETPSISFPFLWSPVLYDGFPSLVLQSGVMSR